MSIRRYFANKDTTITNARKSDGTLATDSNMGAADILEMFSISGSAAGGTGVEKSRILINFDTNAISADRTSGLMPASGSVKFVLKLFNAEHEGTTPSAKLVNDPVIKVGAYPISEAWTEGTGLDMVNYSDKAWLGCSWTQRTSGQNWTTSGGDFLGDESPSHNVFDMESGLENLEIDVSDYVEACLQTSAQPYADNIGLLLKLSGAFEELAGDSGISLYTKKY